MNIKDAVLKAGHGGFALASCKQRHGVQFIAGSMVHVSTKPYPVEAGRLVGSVGVGRGCLPLPWMDGDLDCGPQSSAASFSVTITGTIMDGATNCMYVQYTVRRNADPCIPNSEKQTPLQYYGIRPEGQGLIDRAPKERDRAKEYLMARNWPSFVLSLPSVSLSLFPI